MKKLKIVIKLLFEEIELKNFTPEEKLKYQPNEILGFQSRDEAAMLVYKTLAKFRLSLA